MKKSLKSITSVVTTLKKKKRKENLGGKKSKLNLKKAEDNNKDQSRNQ